MLYDKERTMKISPSKVKQCMAHFEEVCRNSDIKRTHQRMEIFREVAQTGDHPDAEKVYQGVRKRMPTVSLDTVYRTLWMLKDLGLIRTLGLAREKTRFDANLSQHHHFVCQCCGLTQDLYCETYDKLTPPESVKALGRVETTHVEVRGVCRACTRKLESPEL
jgi:Fur family transcriptional regulator, peroxide stress response regulator